MMWVLGVFPFFFLSLKDFSFFSQGFDLSVYSVMMSSICPLAYSTVSMLGKQASNSLDTSFYKFFYFFVVFVSMIFFFCSEGFLVLLFIEICAFPMALGVVRLSKDSEKFISSSFMFLVNVFCSLPFMLYWAYFHTNPLSLSTKLCWVSSDYWLMFCFSMIFLCKIPVFLFHTWLTKAHVSASGPSSMILASLLLKLGSFGVLKFQSMFTKVFSLPSGAMYSLSLLGSTFFLVVMFRLFDVKYMIACSSVFHMAMIYPFLMSGGSSHILGSVLMMVSHGVVSYILFLLVSGLYESFNSRSCDTNKSLHSVSKVSYVFFFFFMFLNLGLPPFLNFMSEMYYFYCLIMYSLVFLSYFSLLAVLCIIFTMFILVSMSFMKKNFYSGKDVEGLVWPIGAYFLGFLMLVSLLFC